LPAVSIHPPRRDALDELERCLEGGAVMLKCLPNCQNIDWNNPRYTRFLERMAESGLILLAHTGSERTLPVLDAKLASPRVLTRALEVGVTGIAALACCNLRGKPATIPRMIEKELAARILHGRDVPRPVSALTMWLGGVLSWREWRASAAVMNPLERDSRIKRSMGFSKETFTRLGGLRRIKPPIRRTAGDPSRTE
jgi:hypothetical protein